nr:unnamed protein product [Spirometra erinaceieuropaei]
MRGQRRPYKNSSAVRRFDAILRRASITGAKNAQPIGSWTHVPFQTPLDTIRVDVLESQTKEFQKELESDPTAAEKIETLSTSLLNDLPGTTGEAISRAHEIQRKRVKAAIIFRKNFSPPAESSVLTCPDEWSAETISKHFPISDPGASKFLFKSQKKPNRVFRSLKSIIRHDTACIGRWINIINVIVELQLEMGYIRPTLSAVLNALSHKLPRDLRWVGLHNFLDLLSFADGNACLPFPPETSLDAYQRKISEHNPGPFQRIAENIQKPLLPDSNLVLMRGQQLDAISMIIGLFKDQDFSPFVNSLRKNPSTSFPFVFREWLLLNSPNSQPSILEKNNPSFLKMRSTTDTDFSKLFRFKRIDG